MNRMRRRYHIAAAAPVLAVFAALYIWSILAADPASVFWIAVLFVMPTSLWLFTSWLLVHHWWQRAGAHTSTLDAPGQLLSTIVAALPEQRQRWGEAMLGELAEIQGRSARWRFAVSCVRGALSMPLPTGRPVLAITGGLMVAAAAYVVAGAVAPGLGFFSASLVAIVGTMMVVGVARARHLRLPVPVATALVIGAVVVSVAATAAFLLQHPAAAEGLPPARAAVLAVVFASCLWLAVAHPRRLSDSRLAPHLGVGAAIAFVLGVLAVGRTGGLPAIWLFFGPMLIFSVPGFIAAVARRSFRAGVQAGIWAAITVMPLSFAVGLVMSLRQHAIDGVWTFAGDVTSAGFSFGFVFMTLLAIPAIGFPFAVMGANVGSLLRDTPPMRSANM